MDFRLTDDQRMLAESLDRYLAQRYPITRRHAAAASALGFDAEVWAGLVELGAVAALLPEAAGGLGGGGFDITTVFESAGRALLIEPLRGALVVGQILARADHPDRVAAWLARVAAGAVVAFAHEEPDAHYEPWHVATTAQRDAHGWVLDGHKAVVAHAAAADGWLVSARLAGGVRDAAGIGLFWVPRDALGVTVQPYPRIDGGGAADLRFTTAQVPAEALVVGPARASEVLAHGLACATLSLCAEALGAMEVALQQTRDYLQTRRQFGRPIGSFQALQHRVVDLWMAVAQARSAVINAAAAFDGGDALERDRLIAAAKATIGHTGTHVAEECIQLHGGIGMTWELPLAHYAKRLVMIDHEYGDEDHHLARFIALSRLREASA
ncbi:acyl-CoA dehydrogenase [Tepidimonas taiwanensis]|uniref:Acyl-CoA dehydrogenase fadE12 n=1 Tax=Tepidimonas taiwanensis TaxID=307486 RepID=A0A554XCE1_9BURK|nr:acyl-CoA dehydrogenase [Tepidimonas taiwanensis]MCX7693279.1 acyl-CoA dehydrogenase [Tepidimonas taiwanensis]MDM7464208.1 acyl-CoA dehydrogenase [Tepidimonas taiwanensis]TSE33510.1 Acyl-CoA dehydrogenase fadE12 [Tepidimonas taiwanensis]UBQ05788.1 acyl-CoA dehydrogenase [Tepidimonas taiwanensis]